MAFGAFAIAFPLQPVANLGVTVHQLIWTVDGDQADDAVVVLQIVVHGQRCIEHVARQIQLLGIPIFAGADQRLALVGEDAPRLLHGQMALANFVGSFPIT